MGNYFTYILTNQIKTVLYIGVTNDLSTRLEQHYEDSQNDKKTFAGKYNCYHLVFWERHPDPSSAIAREKQMKKIGRGEKEKLISKQNPEWDFLNDKI